MSLRAYAAIAAMQGFLANPSYDANADRVAEAAVRYADELL